MQLFFAGACAQQPRVSLNVGKAVSGRQHSFKFTNTITGNLTIAATSEAKRMAYDRSQLALLNGGPVIPLALAPTGRAGLQFHTAIVMSDVKTLLLSRAERGAKGKSNVFIADEASAQ